MLTGITFVHIWCLNILADTGIYECINMDCRLVGAISLYNQPTNGLVEDANQIKFNCETM